MRGLTPTKAEEEIRSAACLPRTKVMRRFGVQYSYIWNCETESEDFRNGFDSFIRVVSVIKAVKNLRIAKFGARPEPFMSVTANEGDLATKLGVTVVPISPNTVAARMDQLIGENSPQITRLRGECKATYGCFRYEGRGGGASRSS